MTIFGDRIMTPRLCLRRVQLEDIPLLVEWSGSATAHGEYLTPDGYDQERWRRECLSGVLWSERNKIFVIDERGGRPLGTVHFWLRPERTTCAVIALKIAAPGDRGKGFGTEAQKHVIITLFDRFKVSEVEMYTDIDNCSQQRCLAKLGFELVESLSFNDQQVNRTGHLYRIDSDTFARTSIYHFHYE